MKWFHSKRRKTDLGNASRWTPAEASPVYASVEFGGYHQADLEIERTFMLEALELIFGSEHTEQEEGERD
jgi:hypothetical protein